MIHKFAVVMELHFNDESGEYVPPSTREIENRVSEALTRTTRHMGFEDNYHIECAQGSLYKAFGVGVDYGE